MSIDVTIIINLHREGRLASATLESVSRAVNSCKTKGVVCECVAILDRSDSETLDTIKSYGSYFKIVQTDFGDLSKARNHAVSIAKGRYSTFIDGDDLWGEDWVWRTFGALSKIDADLVVAHPQLNMYFGRGVTPYFWVHPDMRFDSVSREDIFSGNRWTALSFASTKLYKRFPYHENEISRGFGYEDWLWHIETIYNGILHITVDKTIHFVRRKSVGSLLQQSNNNNILPNISRLENIDFLSDNKSRVSITDRHSSALRLLETPR